MTNRFVFFVFIFVVMQALSWVVDGRSAYATTTLTAAVTRTQTTSITVASTSGFRSADVITIGNEDICYTGITATTFTGLTRGCRGTEAAAHPTTAANGAPTRVYNESTGIVNQIIGFNLLQVLADDGLLRAAWASITALPHLAKSIGKMIIWDYSFLEGPMVWLRYILLALSAGMVLDFIQLVLRRG